MPQREIGYRTVPLSWQELVHIIQVQKDLKRLSRSVEQEKDYQIYMRDLKQEWESVYDHILHSKFSLEKRTNSAGKFFAYPPVSEIKETRKCVVPNDFPYYLDDDIEHWVLWKLGGDCTEEDINLAREEIREKTGVTEFLHWINPPHLKSLPEIDHVHFICR